jgi:hypothetical protein
MFNIQEKSYLEYVELCGIREQLLIFQIMNYEKIIILYLGKYGISVIIV